MDVSIRKRRWRNVEGYQQENANHRIGQQNQERLTEELKKPLRLPSLTGYEGSDQIFRRIGWEVDVFEPDVKQLFREYPETAWYPTGWEPDLWSWCFAVPIPVAAING